MSVVRIPKSKSNKSRTLFSPLFLQALADELKAGRIPVIVSPEALDEVLLVLLARGHIRTLPVCGGENENKST